MFLWLVRHGETADNASRIFQGQSGKGLNGRGRAQAARIAARLARNPPDRIVASDLDRAFETASIIGQACDRPVEKDPDLREVDVGRWTGRGYAEVKELFPEEWAAWEQGLDIRRGNGETYAELADRMERAIARTAAFGGTCLLVSHGGAIKSWIARILGVSAVGVRALAGVGNTGLTIVERDGDAAAPRHRLHSWNDVAHLEGLAVDEHSD
jgi:probable phosphoglycerate mutase